MRIRIIILAVLGGLILGTPLACHFHSRPLPFDAARWRGGDPVARYRMKDSLLRKLATGELRTRVEVEAALGPDDEKGENTSSRAYRMQPNKRLFRRFPTWLVVRFDEHGKVVHFAEST